MSHSNTVSNIYEDSSDEPFWNSQLKKRKRSLLNKNDLYENLPAVPELAYRDKVEELQNEVETIL